MKCIQQFKNSMAIIRQIRNEEWVFEAPKSDMLEGDKCYTATRNDIELWVGSGFLFTGIRNKPWELGVFGPLVWIFAARKKTRLVEREVRKKVNRKVSDLTQ